MLKAKVTTKQIDGKERTIGYIDLIITKAELEELVFDKLREGGSDLPKTKSLEEVSDLISQVNRVLYKWMDDTRVCFTNYEDRKNLYNAYWQEIVDIVKQSLTKGNKGE